jgi:hypothetical protein
VGDQVSRLVLGSMVFSTQPDKISNAFRLLDQFAGEMVVETAGALYCEALQHTSAAAGQTSMGHAVLEYAALLSTRSEHRGTIRLTACAGSLWSRVRSRILARRRGAGLSEQAVMGASRVALGDSGFADAWAEGESMTIAQASAEILEAR